MKLTLYLIVYILSFCGSLRAIDPLETYFYLNCTKPRHVRGCDGTNETKTKMYLYTRSNKEQPEYLHKCGGSLPEDTLYRKGKDTVILVLGYISAVCAMAFPREYKDQFLCREDMNVILIDWTFGNGVDYYSAVRNTKIVGKELGLLVNNIMKQTGDSCDRFHIIGHSLGAQIASLAANYIICKIRRITGLDPAMPAFLHANESERLDPSDAQQVDVIHSNAGYCLFGFALGYPENIGHADFYPNGGSIQLSCIPYILQSVLKGDIYYAFVLLLGPFCPHFQSVQYFKESINACNCQFIGVRCNSYKEFKLGKCRSCNENGNNCAVMGMDWEYYPPENKNATTNASYYLKTNHLFCPYCNNKYIKHKEEFLNKSDYVPHCFSSTNRTCSLNIQQSRTGQQSIKGHLLSP